MKPVLAALFFLALTGCASDSSPEASGAPTTEASGHARAVDRAEAVERDVNFNATVAAGAPALDGFELTLDRMRRWGAASANLRGLLSVQPTLEESWAQADVDPTDYEARLAQIEAEPEASRAVSRAGLSVEEFVAIEGAYRRADSGDAAATPENVAFVAEHRAEIDAYLAGEKKATPAG